MLGQDDGRGDTVKSQFCQNSRQRFLSAPLSLFITTFVTALVTTLVTAATAFISPANAQNATSSPLILISIDGFRPDYLNRQVTPNLNALAAKGVRAEAMAGAGSRGKAGRSGSASR